MKPAPDMNELMVRFREGDRPALVHVYKMYHKNLCNFAQGLLNNKIEAKDIVADAMELLMQKREHFFKIENVKAFLYLTVKYRCFDHLKRSKLSQFGDDESFELQDDFEAVAISKMIRTEVNSELHNKISMLPSKQRKVITLLFLEEQSVQSTAQELKMTPEAVRKAKSLGLHSLRMLFAERRLLPLTGFFLLILRYFSHY
jgi:RNA polymerase sigma-70 factor (ECF subfamily)